MRLYVKPEHLFEIAGNGLVAFWRQHEPQQPDGQARRMVVIGRDQGSRSCRRAVMPLAICCSAAYERDSARAPAGSME